MRALLREERATLTRELQTTVQQTVTESVSALTGEIRAVAARTTSLEVAQQNLSIKVADHAATHAEMKEEHSRFDQRLVGLQGQIDALSRSSTSDASIRAPSVGSAGSTSASSSRLGSRMAFVPRYFEVKRFCEWSERLEKGATEEIANQWLEEAKTSCPQFFEIRLQEWK